MYCRKTIHKHLLIVQNNQSYWIVTLQISIASLHLHEPSRTGKSMESRLVVARGWGEGENEEWLLMGPGFLFGVMRILDSGDGCRTLNVVKTTNLSVQMVKGMWIISQKSHKKKINWLNNKKKCFKMRWKIKLYTPSLLIILSFNLKILNILKFECEGTFISTNFTHFTRKLTDTRLRKWRI